MYANLVELLQQLYDKSQACAYGTYTQTKDQPSQHDEHVTVNVYVTKNRLMKACA